MIVALLALFVALGGSSYAADLFGCMDAVGVCSLSVRGR